jgi:hypothetical protein
MSLLIEVVDKNQVLGLSSNTKPRPSMAKPTFKNEAPKSRLSSMNEPTSKRENVHLKVPVKAEATPYQSTDVSSHDEGMKKVKSHKQFTSQTRKPAASSSLAGSKLNKSSPKINKIMPRNKIDVLSGSELDDDDVTDMSIVSFRPTMDAIPEY